MYKKSSPDSGRSQGKTRKTFFRAIGKYFITILKFVKPKTLQEQLEDLNIVLFEKRRDAGFVEGGR